MKPISFTISKNAIILTLLTLLSGVIVFDQIKIRKQEALLELYRENRELRIISDSLSLVKEAMITDSLLEANKLLKKKVDYYFEYYRESITPDTFSMSNIYVACGYDSTALILDKEWFNDRRYQLQVDSGSFVFKPIP